MHMDTDVCAVHCTYNLHTCHFHQFNRLNYIIWSRKHRKHYVMVIVIRISANWFRCLYSEHIIFLSGFAGEWNGQTYRCIESDCVSAQYALRCDRLEIDMCFNLSTSTTTYYNKFYFHSKLNKQLNLNTMTNFIGGKSFCQVGLSTRDMLCYSMWFFPSCNWRREEEEKGNSKYQNQNSIFSLFASSTFRSIWNRRVFFLHGVHIFTYSTYVCVRNACIWFENQLTKIAIIAIREIYVWVSHFLSL